MYNSPVMPFGPTVFFVGDSYPMIQIDKEIIQVTYFFLNKHW